MKLLGCLGLVKMERLKFYDLKKKKVFYSDKYRIVKKNGRKFAVTNAPSGIESWRIVS